MLETEYDLAYKLAQHHLERLCKEEAEAQFAYARKLPKRMQKGFQLRYSAAVETLIEMSRDPALTRERVLGFLHAAESYGFEDERRIAIAGLAKRGV